eukprot:CAMPEP_0174930406 /NCGR_PEP_ID=MMETSP1355-20121228/31145_1 /TAXON_ID=464990 /ORGANISM="Hemiselmis tepida, Strain CCMP443" /LENGTH=77 /DNA_ID=CAMNT_0016176699 /DNA_START=45 /DNA_END=278 /DNA_ORIENTATION=+
MVAEELQQTQLHLWSRIVTGHQLFGTRFSEGVDAVKDLTEEALLHKSTSLLHGAEESVKHDMHSDFKSYGHHMWNLK